MSNHCQSTVVTSVHTCHQDKRVILYREASKPIQDDPYFKEIHSQFPDIIPSFFPLLTFDFGSKCEQDQLQEYIKQLILRQPINIQKDGKKEGEYTKDDAVSSTQTSLGSPNTTKIPAGPPQSPRPPPSLQPLPLQPQYPHSAIVLTSSTGAKALYQAITCLKSALIPSKGTSAQIQSKDHISTQLQSKDQISTLLEDQIFTHTPKVFEIQQKQFDSFFKTFPIIVVGQGTAKTARSFGFQNVIVPPPSHDPVTVTLPPIPPSHDNTVLPASPRNQNNQSTQHPPPSPKTTQIITQPLKTTQPLLPNQILPATKTTQPLPTPQILPATKAGKTTSFNAVQLALFISTLVNELKPSLSNSSHTNENLSMIPPSQPPPESPQQPHFPPKLKEQSKSSPPESPPQQPQIPSSQTTPPPQISPILLISSKIRQDTLTHHLNMHNIIYTEHIAYDTVPNCDLWSQFRPYTHIFEESDDKKCDQNKNQYKKYDPNDDKNDPPTKNKNEYKNRNECKNDPNSTLSTINTTTTTTTPDITTTTTTTTPDITTTFHVIFSPSGLQSIMNHLRGIYTLLLLPSALTPTTLSSITSTPSLSVPATSSSISSLSIPTTTQKCTLLSSSNFLDFFSDAIFISIGATTEKAFIQAEIQLHDWKTHLNSQELGILSSLPSSSSSSLPSSSLQSSSSSLPSSSLPSQSQQYSQHLSSLLLPPIQPFSDISSTNPQRSIVLANFLNFSFSSLLTCVVPSPAGVCQQIKLYFGKL